MFDHRQPNCMVLTTSNITGAIDLAFVDRADIKAYVGLPGTSAIYKMLESCLMELMKRDIIRPAEDLEDFEQLPDEVDPSDVGMLASYKLRVIARCGQSYSIQNA
jgi:hypothetical protein